jgi:hypothetical protein
VWQPDLLSDPRRAILAWRRKDAVIAGAVVYNAGRAAGISNLFSTGLAPDRLWAGIQPAVAGLRPHLPVVGYEEGASLEAAQQAGFHALGSLSCSRRRTRATWREIDGGFDEFTRCSPHQHADFALAA